MTEEATNLSTLEPWVVTITQLAQSRAVTVGPPGGHPALRAYSAPDMEARAALAAAAPDMAMALQAVLKRATPFQLGEPEIVEARAALAKARVTP
jgi:hypothetical protein